MPFQIQRIEKDGFAKLIAQLLKVTAAAKATGAASVPSDPTPRQPASPPPPAVDPGPTVIFGEQKVESANRPLAAGPSPDPTAPSPDAAVPAPVETAETMQVAPERLHLEEWEREAINECYPLFRTPRAVKRPINTYCLIRVGVDATQWRQFLGSTDNPKAEYRTPLLMMAVAAAYPSLAFQWLQFVVKDETWIAAVTKPIIDSNREGKNNLQGQWDQLTTALTQLNANEFAPFDTVLVLKWVPKVRRYFF